ncbi:metallophosphoesterase [Haloprofundus marisrubri]|uniref:Metallophosphoesterase n=1 Tax=Haloprofundus marisrubri TaxID=1514971 RepID=A0A0W1R8R1_9EURY|nr:metallophosphoesterase family protein [Haloprofundus marisrubri]KTG09739.1 metallophosphoesterase [Haloprofundus marisrubri]
MDSLAVTPEHRRLDADDWKGIYVIGDVHGCHRELEDLLDELDPDDNELLVFVGDLVRKGPDNHGVVELVRSLDNAVSVRGNNEAKLFRGDATLPELTDEDMRYLESLPVAISWDDNLVVHGGVNPHRKLVDHTTEELLNMREPTADESYGGPFWWEYHEGPPRVFFGHTPLDSPVDRPHAIGLDTGCVYGGSLTAYDCARDEFVNVPARETYEERSDSDVVSPPVDNPTPSTPSQ